jgi:RNA polymerase sigma-70 factor (ECF subfamily)
VTSTHAGLGRRGISSCYRPHVSERPPICGGASEAPEEAAALAAARAGDGVTFSALSEAHRPALRAHCYRMLGSFDEAEDMVQETMLRAWRAREGFEGRSLLRTWLYRIATNVCLDALERSPHRVLPQDVAPPVTAETPHSEARTAPTWSTDVRWLQPFPDDRLEAAAPSDAEPEAALATRQTIGLAFLAALQHLPPRQRACLVLADVVGWSAAEIAALLEMTVAAVNSALQRAHASMRERVPASDAQVAGDDERQLLQTFMRAWEHGNVTALVESLREDVRWAMPPAPLWFHGRDAVANLLRLFPPDWQGRAFRMVATHANGQPAAAAYMRLSQQTEYRFVALHVLRVAGGQIAEITTFSPELCAGFAMAATL